MPKKTKGKPELTAQDYLLKANMHRLTLMHQWKLFLQTGLISLATLGVVIVIAVAWFASNDKVQGDWMSVTATSGGNYELAVTGQRGKWDVDKEGVFDGEEVVINDKTYRKTGSKSAIFWSVNNQSHFQNLEEDSQGLEPGDSGSLTFYILPNISGSLEVNFELQLTGLGAELEEIPQEAQNLLLGHILLFAGYDDGLSIYKGWISDDANSWTMELPDGNTLSRLEDGSLNWKGEVEKNQVYPVTLYWIWPEFFGQYIFKNQNHLMGRPVLFTKDSHEADTLTALPAGLFDSFIGTSEDAVSNRYLKWARSTDPEEEKDLGRAEFESYTTKESLLGLRDESDYSLFTYGKICNFYNRADQYIGENISYAKLQLIARQE